ncbi:MAG: hypothetical protein OEY67_09645 [Gammaproteobacteria bacterium]|nr:hypothetical protein [Gammaproteobacteria bacterium]
MNRPQFTTAIPQRRYQVGEYEAIILGEIETEGPVQYQYILAMIVEGSREPKLYVTLERDQADKDTLRVLGHELDEVLGTSGQWREPLAFTASALSVAMEVLGLTDEVPALLQ